MMKTLSKLTVAATVMLGAGFALPVMVSASGSGLHAEFISTHGSPDYFYNGRGKADVLDAASRVKVDVGCSNGSHLYAYGNPGGSGGGEGVWVQPVSDCYVRHFGHAEGVIVSLVPAPP